MNSRIPLHRGELDTEKLCVVDTVHNTIKFNKVGFYHISFTVNAYIKNSQTTFNPTTDYISVGFRQINTDNTYIGASTFIKDQTPEQLFAQGVITVENSNNVYELANLTKQSIYLLTPQLENINSTSYFSNSVVTLIAVYLGRPQV